MLWYYLSLLSVIHQLESMQYGLRSDGSSQCSFQFAVILIIYDSICFVYSSLTRCEFVFGFHENKYIRIF